MTPGKTPNFEMPFKYNPPTRSVCEVCERLHEHEQSEPLIKSQNGKASSANNFPFHNWYNFVLGYSPEFPDYILDKEQATSETVVLDPFAGSGTTLVCCKSRGIPSFGVDANDFMVEAARAKLDWQVDVTDLKRLSRQVLKLAKENFARFSWHTADLAVAATSGQMKLHEAFESSKPSHTVHAEQHRPLMLLPKYISPRPLAELLLINEAIETSVADAQLKKIFDLALSALIVPVSNVRYGPGFGIIKPQTEKDVLRLFAEKLNRMIDDLEKVSEQTRATVSECKLADSRTLGNFYTPESVSLMITSPPYPGDHEYTKHTRLELIFRGYARDLNKFRTIKQRMLRASTTNLYRTDNDRAHVSHLASIHAITDLIQQRLETDGATSGFEKLYTKLVWEYFGGMYRALSECYQVLKPGGKIFLLVSDSHAFKMVHIQTAQILVEIGTLVGFVCPEIILWQLKSTTSHRYELRENIVALTKPK